MSALSKAVLFLLGLVLICLGFGIASNGERLEEPFRIGVGYFVVLIAGTLLLSAIFWPNRRT